MKKRSKIILIVIASIVLLGIIFGTIDSIRANDEKTPIFTIYIGKNENTDADMYMGLGYWVIKCPYVEDTKDFQTEHDFVKLFPLSKSHICIVGGGILEKDENFSEDNQ